jgi:hypothetical protein
MRFAEIGDNEMIHTARFDILKRTNEGTYIWLEAAPDLEVAKNRLQDLSAATPDEHFVFDQQTQQVVAKVGRRGAI